MTEKKFAVIYFPAESLYSEVPVSWLTTDRLKCWWPNSINARALMVRGDKPKDSWNLHVVNVEAYCSTLEGARKKAEIPDYCSSASASEEKGRGLRKKKKKYIITDSDENGDSSSETVTPPPSPHSSNFYEVTRTATQDRPIIIEVQDQLSLTNITQLDQIEALPNVPDQEISNSGRSIASSAPISVGEEDVLRKSDVLVCSPVYPSHQGRTIDEIYIKMTKLEKLMEGMVKILTSLQIATNSGESNTKHVELVKFLPLKSYEDVVAFDQTVEEEGMMEAYSNIIKNIGGKDVKDYVNRSLTTLFTDELGKLCSLVGQRGNIRLESFNFMKLLQDVILGQSSTNKYEIEKNISEWFRLSNQRLKRSRKI